MPKVTLAYDVTPDFRIGAMVQKAYNPGGTTIRVDTLQPDEFKAERLWDYELFARGKFAGGRGSRGGQRLLLRHSRRAARAGHLRHDAKRANRRLRQSLQRAQGANLWRRGGAKLASDGRASRPGWRSACSIRRSSGRKGKALSSTATSSTARRISPVPRLRTGGRRTSCGCPRSCGITAPISAIRRTGLLFASIAARMSTPGSNMPWDGYRSSDRSGTCSTR